MSDKTPHTATLVEHATWWTSAEETSPAPGALATVTALVEAAQEYVRQARRGTAMPAWHDLCRAVDAHDAWTPAASGGSGDGLGGEREGRGR